MKINHLQMAVPLLSCQLGVERSHLYKKCAPLGIDLKAARAQAET